jgi:hypothetical protein
MCLYLRVESLYPLMYLSHQIFHILTGTSLVFITLLVVLYSWRIVIPPDSSASLPIIGRVGFISLIIKEGPFKVIL